MSRGTRGTRKSSGFSATAGAQHISGPKPVKHKLSVHNRKVARATARGMTARIRFIANARRGMR